MMEVRTDMQLLIAEIRALREAVEQIIDIMEKPPWDVENSKYNPQTKELKIGEAVFRADANAALEDKNNQRNSG